MNEYKRIFVIVLDSLGIGAMPDSPRFGDEGVDTFGHILEKMKTLEEMSKKELLEEIKCMMEDEEANNEATALKAKIFEFLTFCTGQDMRELRAVLGILESSM